MYVFIAMLSALFYGVADFAGGFAARRATLSSVVFFSQLAGAAMALAFILIQGLPPPSASALAWSLAAGLSGLMGLLVLYHGIATGIVAIVSPVSALVAALLPAAFGIALGERPSLPAMAGAAVCLPAILLLSWERRGGVDPAKARDSLFHGLLAGAGFGGFFIALSLTKGEAGLWPVFSARLTSLAVSLALILMRRETLSLPKGGRFPTLLAGLSDMGANMLFFLATRTGYLSIVSVISSLFPAPTVILARVFMKERIPPARVAGLVLALSGVALISLR